MSDTSSSGRFPLALRSAAAARWSHRDPVEAGNPFPPEDERHQTWNAATRRAKDALARIDEQLDAAEKAGPHPDPYPVRLVALAEARFDVWAARLLTVVQGPEALADYEAWLATYVANWLAYVADTCPRVAVEGGTGGPVGPIRGVRLTPDPRYCFLRSPCRRRCTRPYDAAVRSVER